MHRFYHPALTMDDVHIQLDARASAHARARRLAIDETIQVFNGAGLIADATVQSVQSSHYDCAVRGAVRRQSLPSPQLHMTLCMPKGDALELAVSMLGELGVSSIQLAYSERTINRWPSMKVDARLQRLQRLLIEACEVSGRATVPALRPPTSLRKVVEADAKSTALRVVFWEESTRPLPEVWAAAQSSAQDRGGATTDVVAIIGPEGGFSMQEVDAVQQAGYQHASLGPWVMRVPTAAVAATAQLLLLIQPQALV
jgi:16S rRNA (uracil1498-N3)-methyltransferase